MSTNNSSTMITIDEFAKVEIRVGKIVEAAAVKESEKLIREVVDFSVGPNKEYKVIFSGIRKWFTPEELVGKKFLYVTNLEPRKMPSMVVNDQNELVPEYSEGMIMAVDGPEGKPILVSAEELPVGAKVR